VWYPLGVKIKTADQATKMKNFLCLVSCFLPVMLFAQTPFDGTWKTNIAESKLSQKPYEYSVNDGMYHCKSCAPEIRVKADGQDQPVSGQTFDTIAVQVVDANTIHLTAKKAGITEFETTRTASQDGQLLTSTTIVYPPDGSQPYKAKGKYALLSKGPDGSNATSGSWRVLNVDEDAAALISTWKSVGDRLSRSTPSGISWEGKLDGKEYRVKGNSANETIALKQLGDRSIEATVKRDGKIEWVETITVSSDGKKMTSVVDSKLTGRISTYVDDKQ
jgi:hypothetical protein